MCLFFGSSATASMYKPSQLKVSFTFYRAFLSKAHSLKSSFLCPPCSTNFNVQFVTIEKRDIVLLHALLWPWFKWQSSPEREVETGKKTQKVPPFPAPFKSCKCTTSSVLLLASTMWETLFSLLLWYCFWLCVCALSIRMQGISNSVSDVFSFFGLPLIIFCYTGFTFNAAHSTLATRKMVWMVSQERKYTHHKKIHWCWK